MQKRTKYIALILALCLIGGLAWYVHQSMILTLPKITYGGDYTITSQRLQSVEITIDKSKLPSDMDFTKEVSFAEDECICYQTDTSTIYLNSIYVPVGEPEYLAFDFKLSYNLPKPEGSLLITGVIEEDDYRVSSGNIYINNRDAYNVTQHFENAVSLRGIGAGERFHVYIKAEDFMAAQDEIKFVVNGFNELFYQHI